MKILEYLTLENSAYILPIAAGAGLCLVGKMAYNYFAYRTPPHIAPVKKSKILGFDTVEDEDKHIQMVSETLKSKDILTKSPETYDKLYLPQVNDFNLEEDMMAINLYERLESHTSVTINKIFIEMTYYLSSFGLEASKRSFQILFQHLHESKTLLWDLWYKELASTLAEIIKHLCS